MLYYVVCDLIRKFSSPLSGTFFNRVPAKPQPVCSRERIRGGDG